MAAKSDKEPKFPKKGSAEINSASKKPSKSKKQLEEEDELEDDEVIGVSKKTSKVSGSKGDDDNEEDVELDVEADDWNKADEDEDWDPDFAEFDLPKSKTAKKAPGGKKGAKDDDDFKIDDEFKDLSGGLSSRQDDEDDF